MAYDHGAFRVRDREASIRFYTEKLGFRLLFRNNSEEYGERGAFLEYNGARLELLETIGAVYQPVPPERPYCPHLCFEAEDMDQVLQSLSEEADGGMGGDQMYAVSDRETSSSRVA